jgi:hypothetical protein
VIIFLYHRNKAFLCVSCGDSFVGAFFVRMLSCLFIYFKKTFALLIYVRHAFVVGFFNKKIACYESGFNLNLFAYDLFEFAQGTIGN